MTIANLPAYRIVDRMRRAGVTQCAIAHKLGVHQSCVSKVIRRRKGPSAGTRERVWVAIEIALGHWGHVGPLPLRRPVIR